MKHIDLLEGIQGRRSIHDFKPQEIDRNIMEKIFGYASWAPNHRMKEPWRVKLFQGGAKHTLTEEIIQSYIRMGYAKDDDQLKIDQMMANLKQFLINIPHHALIYMDKDPDDRYYEEDYAAVCAYIQNAQLAAWEFEIGMLWTSSPYLYDTQFATSIGLDPEKQKLVAVLQIGYPDKIPKEKPRAPLSNHLEWL